MTPLRLNVARALLLAALGVGATATGAAQPAPAPNATAPGELFHARVNFQPGQSLLPSGYLTDLHKLADVGRPYGPQRQGGLTYSYGWARDNTAGMRAAPGASLQEASAQEGDTSALLEPGNAWQIAVPNGLYRVQFLGAARGAGGVSDVLLEGQDTGAVGTGGPPSVRSATVRVTDGRLTVRGGPATVGGALNWIDVQQLLSVKINFQPAGVPAPAGYLADGGAVFGNRGGLKYGWKSDNTAGVRAYASGADVRYNTLALIGPDNSWQIELPTGQYDVRVVAGDPGAAGGVYQLNVTGEGGPRAVINRKAVSGGRWAEGAVRTVQVGGFLGSPSLLTISAAPGAQGGAIDFVEIQQTGLGR